MNLPTELARPLHVVAEQLEEVVEQADEGVPVDRPLAGEASALVVAERFLERLPGNVDPGTHFEESANGPRVHVHGAVIRRAPRDFYS